MSNKATDRPDWKEQILDWENSGLSQKEYCHQKELPYQRFVYEGELRLFNEFELTAQACDQNADAQAEDVAIPADAEENNRT